MAIYYLLQELQSNDTVTNRVETGHKTIKRKGNNNYVRLANIGTEITDKKQLT